MANKTKNLEELTYDLNEIGEDTEYPVRFVCEAIKTVVEPIVEPDILRNVSLCIEEMVKDVEVHGNKYNPRKITVCEKEDGIIIDTFDKPKKRSKHNKLGGLILKSMFGDDYSATMDGDMFRGHLFIRSAASQQSSKTKYAA